MKVFALRTRGILEDQSGQMTIFIALIFQVLFVFFAMVVNVGLLVHDKINLQNSVDLGAFYAAQRQAESLNEIAHINYQLRQDYKLLTWRYRVLSTLGRGAGTNSYAPEFLSGPVKDVLWGKPYGTTGKFEPPVACVANQYWSEFQGSSAETEQYCKNTPGSTIPKVPDIPIIAPWITPIIAAAAFAKKAQAAQAASCDQAGPLSWVFLAQNIYAYKLSIASRKQMLHKLRKNLVSATPLDQRMELVRDGVLATVKNNLTRANEASFDDQYFEFKNGLALGPCGQHDGEMTLPEVPTAPLYYYLALLSSAGCTTQVKAFDAPDHPTPAQLGAYTDPKILSIVTQEPPIGSGSDMVFHSTLGFEKNPWCMAWVGVRAKTKPRKPFAPFGGAIEMEARAFAQPFGGRVGPWYMSRWPQGSPNSAGGDRVDRLTSPRLLKSGFDASGGVDLTDWEDRLPNFSRYPGDTLGLRSQLALAASRHFFTSFFPPTGPAVPGPLRLKLAYYGNFDEIPVKTDPLAWEPDQTKTDANPVVRGLRAVEMAAIAPDLFDTTYYSIDPNYFAVYIAPDNSYKRFEDLPPIFGKKISPMQDLGGRNDDGPFKQVGVAEQMLVANNQGSLPNMQAGIDPKILSQYYYVLTSWKHLLTGWIAARAQNFTIFPDETFGKCEVPAAAAVPIPGSCHQNGGRVGYSVRVVSREHLLQGTWQVGGDGEPPGPILNPPDIAW